MQPWLTELQQLLAHGDAVVLVTVARVEGSTPREAGAKMIVTRDSARYTIGGGHLEWRAIEIARDFRAVLVILPEAQFLQPRDHLRPGPQTQQQRRDRRARAAEGDVMEQAQKRQAIRPRCARGPIE